MKQNKKQFQPFFRKILIDRGHFRIHYEQFLHAPLNLKETKNHKISKLFAIFHSRKFGMSHKAPDET